jgi:hypothetical protein
MRKPRVLTACRPLAVRTLKSILTRHADLMFVHSLAGAKDVLIANPDIEMAICGVHFDGSRMYELLEYAHLNFPYLPFICVRILNGDILEMSRDLVALAAESLGAAAYVDFAASMADEGPDIAQQLLETIVLTHLHKRPEWPLNRREPAMNRLKSS